MIKTDKGVLRTTNEWVAWWNAHHGTNLNINTTRQRRKCSGLGIQIPPSTYLLTEAEFAQVLDTPLPNCNLGAKEAR